MLPRLQKSVNSKTGGGRFNWLKAIIGESQGLYVFLILPVRVGGGGVAFAAGITPWVKSDRKISPKMVSGIN